MDGQNRNRRRATMTDKYLHGVPTILSKEGLSWFSEVALHLPRLTGQHRLEHIVALSPEGREHRTFRVVLSNQTHLILKWFTNRQHARLHHRILESVSATDIPSPSPVGFVEFTDYHGSVVLMENLPGVLWWECAGVPELDCLRINAAASLLIQIESLDPESLPWKRVSPEFWSREFQNDAQIYARRIREISLPPIAGEANEVLMCLTVEPWTQIPDHGDFGPHNLLCDGAALAGLIDWDRASIQDRSRVLGTAVAEMLALTIPIEQRRVLVGRLFTEYANGLGFDVSECRWRALPDALTRTLDWLCYQKGAPMHVHVESLKELLKWR